MVKKWIALLLVCAMALGMWACGSDNATKDPTDGSTVPTTNEENNEENNSEENNNEENNDEENNNGENDDNVTGSKLPWVFLTEKNYESGTETLKATIEMDVDSNIIGIKIYEVGELVFEATYDKDVNKPLMVQSFENGGETFDRTEYVYDENGNCLEEVNTYNKYDNETTTVRSINTYTATGKIATMTVVTNDVKMRTESYTYDEYDNVLTQTDTHFTWDYTGEYTYENVYENGKLVEVTCYSDDELFSYTNYRDDSYFLGIFYDDEGTEDARWEEFYENDKLVKYVYSSEWGTTTVLYSYNADGKPVEYSYEISDRGSARWVINYDEDGNFVGMKGYRDGQLQGDYTLTYENVEMSEAVFENVTEMLQRIMDSMEW